MWRAIPGPIVLMLGTLLSAPAQPASAQPGTNSAQAQLTEYFKAEVAEIANRCLAEAKTRSDWEAKRPVYRQQLLEMLGLRPLPERTELHAVVTGRLEHDGVVIERVQFQALPRLYCTANLYLPTGLTQPAPAVLYLCGHWRQMTNGISLGNKTAYQHNGLLFARNGYVCLVLDSLQLGEILGVHTGTRDLGLWWWNSRGYTPAGAEAWCGIRALDYLCTRPEVDTNRLGVTGHSGGGAYSWTVTALDDRVKAAAPLAGMADLQSHVLDGVLDRHCDCNFFINVYRWDFPQLAALAAPRPVLIGATDNDPIFRLDSTIRIHDKVRRVYELYGAPDKLGLVIAPGQHTETPELHLAVLRWFNKHVKQDTAEPVLAAPKPLPREQLRVFDSLPEDAVNTNAVELFAPYRPAEPESADQLRAELRRKVFAGWPADEPSIRPKLAVRAERNGLRLSVFEFASQHHVELRLYLLERSGTKRPRAVVLEILSQADWTNWLGTVGAAFTNELAE
ncbi:MAG: alpha/beta hydrolase family protein, partial [Verrucomicrobiae bacterium]|nr:alpha/beta hydrolase family protein [Verrucomicrobiae bacterium]